MNKPLRLAIFGASGRNGKRLIAIGQADPSVSIVGALVGSASKSLGQDAGELAGIGPIGLKLTNAWPSGLDAVIDFSSPEGCMSALEQCVDHRVPLVIATTGLSANQISSIDRASEVIPICYAPNMSVAVNVAMKLAEQAARALKDVPSGADVEIIERHHRYKEDSPSGTALKFGQIVAKEMGISKHTHGRHGMIGKRPHNEIGYHAVRVGDDAGQHNIVFGMLGETIEIRVAASNRDCYATGAIAAAKFLAGKAPGMYSMADVLGL
ncbi:MAG: 4-hydroxy-tetrahydrodipicolinate reductase [Pirellula sp.]|nr:4-hydroxy-tetrahydrodipicolinate reductase [Pirellula sp.]